jgi:hypothetical protein
VKLENGEKETPHPVHYRPIFGGPKRPTTAAPRITQDKKERDLSCLFFFSSAGATSSKYYLKAGNIQNVSRNFLLVCLKILLRDFRHSPRALIFPRNTAISFYYKVQGLIDK